MIAVQQSSSHPSHHFQPLSVRQSYIQSISFKFPICHTNTTPNSYTLASQMHWLYQPINSSYLFLHPTTLDPTYSSHFPTNYLSFVPHTPSPLIFPPDEYPAHTHNQPTKLPLDQDPTNILNCDKMTLPKGSSIAQITPLSCSPKKKNVRNIIPNLARKIVGFLCSEDSISTLYEAFPQLTQEQIKNFYAFTRNHRNKLGFYIGNRDLLRLWFTSTTNKQHLAMVRVLSKAYLEKHCIGAIVLSRRMKPCLKKEHLRYRRKMLKLLSWGSSKEEGEQ